MTWKLPATTNWGKSDYSHKIADGVYWVGTPSHGGYIVSPERLAEMKPEYRACSFTKDNHFEEDCSWCAVVLQWPQFFGGDDRRRANELYDRAYAPKRPDGEIKAGNGSAPGA